MRPLENSCKQQQGSQIWMSATDRAASSTAQEGSTPQAVKKHLSLLSLFLVSLQRGGGPRSWKTPLCAKSLWQGYCLGLGKRIWSLY